MIRLAENLNVLSAPCENSPFGCQIWSKAKAYGLDKTFAQFWTDDKAAYAKTDGAVCVAGEIGDAEEARAFLSAVGAQTVICDGENAEKLGLKIDMGGVTLKKTLQNASAAVPEEISPRGIYKILKANDMAGDFEPFYLDLSHRMRHGTVRCAGIFKDGEMLAAAAAVLGEKEALISAVGVLPAFHRRGYGRSVSEKIERLLPGGTVYVLREDGKNEAFYDALRYAPCGTWRQGTLY